MCELGCISLKCICIDFFVNCSFFYWIQVLFSDLYELLIEKNNFVCELICKYFPQLVIFLFFPSMVSWFSIIVLESLPILSRVFQATVSDFLRSPQVLGMSTKIETSRDKVPLLTMQDTNHPHRH